ncbi:hypothetical protein ES702_03695 [subsurface metagenome]
MKEKFKGFTRPTYTQTPNEVFDVLLDMLNGSELKVLLYIIRRTFGFKKESDNISLNQIVNGIKKKDGSIQDYGTGISKLSARKAVKRLIDKNVILKIRRKDKSGKDKSPNYSLNIIENLLIKNRDIFMGFTIPNYTLVPDEVFDVLLSRLSGSELKTILYIIRLTFGYSKKSENISLKRLLKGYKDKDGDIVDRGVGVNKKTLIKTIKILSKKKVIIREKRFSKEKGDEPTNYRLNLKFDPWGKKLPLRGVKNIPSVEEIITPPVVEKITPHIKNIHIKNIQQHVDVVSKNAEEKTLRNLLDLKIDKNVAKSLVKNHSYKKINTYIEYLNHKLDKGFKPKDSIAAFLVDSIVNSYILPEGFKTEEELEKERKLKKEILKRKEEIENIKIEKRRKTVIEENINILKKLGYKIDKDTIDLWSKIKRLMKVNKDYIVAMELAHLVKDKENNYILVTGLFENQYKKLKNHKNKINSYLDKVTEIKNSLEIIYDRKINF